MTGVIEAVGDVATGAAWSRTVEPHAGERTGCEDHGACLNCGTDLTGRYCHACGQSSHVHRTLMSIVHDLLHGVFHFEGKIWRTVPMLLFHPGQLTRRYIAGERARFVSPLALFLFTVFLMFSIFSAIAPADLTGGLADGFTRTGGARLKEVHAQDVVDIALAERERAQLLAAGRPTATVDRRLVGMRDDLRALAIVQQRIASARTSTEADDPTGISWLDKGIKHARENPGLTIYKVQSAAYKFSWALIFLSTPFVALLFLWRRRFGLYDHTTFVTYSISFMSLMAIVAELLFMMRAPTGMLSTVLTIAPPVHMFAQLRGAYSLSIVSALWRTIALSVFAVFVLVMFVLGVVAMQIMH